MNVFNCYVKEYRESNVFEKNGLVFKNVAIVQVEIDGKNLYDISGFDNAIVVADELLRSFCVSGKYLIFTSLNGFADEGGWDGVDVKYNEETVEWVFEISNIKYFFIFDVLTYRSVFIELEKTIKNLDLKIEPSSVIFPFDWSGA
jgi:hypothetical protein